MTGHWIEKKNKGFTIVEVIIAVAMLAIVSLPILGAFSQSTKYNAKARNIQKATIAAQTVMEDIKAEHNIESMAQQFDWNQQSNGWRELTEASIAAAGDSSKQMKSVAASGSAITVKKDASGNYQQYYFYRPVTIDGTKYDALITLDPLNYYNTGSANRYKSANDAPKASTLVTNIYYNMLDVPAMHSIYTDRNIVAVESNQKDEALQSLAVNYMTNKGITDYTTAKTYIDDAFADGKITRKAVLNMHYTVENGVKSSTMMTAEVYFEYTITDGAYHDEVEVYLVEPQEFEVDSFDSIYFFYAYTDSSVTSDELEWNIYDDLNPVHPFDFLLYDKLKGKIRLFIMPEEKATLHSSYQFNITTDATYGIPNIMDLIAVETGTTKKMIYTNITQKTGNSASGVWVSSAKQSQDNMITTKKKQRMVDASIAIYQSGELYYSIDSIKLNRMSEKGD